MEEQIEKVFTIDENTEKTQNAILFMNSVSEKVTHMMTSFDTQINILVGIEISVCVLSITSLEAGKHNIAFFILSFFSIIASIVGVYAIHPPKRMIKKGQIESVFYNKKVASFPSYKEYTEELLKLVDGHKTIITEYAIEIYNTYKYHYRPRRDLFKVSRFVFLIGVTLAVVTYLAF
ncbi:MAG: hypothetical protein WCO09_01520 [bacterium]